MSEGIDYAEMLEIPVATVNVVKKKRHRLRDLKLLAVGKVNEKMAARERERDGRFAGNEIAEESFVTAEGAQQIEGEGAVEMENQAPSANNLRRERTHPVLIVEFALAGLLCLGIFLTNVFVADSAINTFIRTVLNPDVGSSSTAQTYSDFELSSVVSEYADVEIILSSTGVLSFSADCSVYPACAGTVSSITQSGETYTVVVAHSNTFESVYTGLTTVYNKKGDAVLPNVPFAYTSAEGVVQVSFYQDGQILNCYSVDAENCLSWNE